MENNEIMNYEETGMDVVDVVETENSGMSTGAAIAVGAGLTLAIGVGVKLVKKGISWFKAKREARRYGEDDAATEKDVEDVAE